MSRKIITAALMSIGWGLIAAGPLPAQTFLGKTAETWLKELDKGDAGARRGAAFALGKLRAGPALVALENRLQNDTDKTVREAAAYALGEIGRGTTNEQLVPVLTAALTGDASPEVRRSAAFALGCLEANALPALPQLHAALGDKSPLVRRSVAWALARVGEQAMPALGKALHDEDALVKRDAAMSLASCIDRSVNPLSLKVVRPLVRDLAALCREDNSDVRRAALNVLIKIVKARDNQQIVLDISLALKDRDEEVLNYAALTLGNIGGEGAAVAVPQLRKALNQPADLELRRQAAVGLGNIRAAARDAVPDLVAALTVDDTKLRSAAAVALGGIGDKAQDAYEPLLQRIEDVNENEQVRIDAGFALSKLGRCPAAFKNVPRILKVLGDEKQPSSVRDRIIWALRVHYTDDLGRMPNVIPTFYKVLSEGKTADNKMLLYSCAALLGVIQRKEVEPPVLRTLLDFLKDDSVRIFVGMSSNVGGSGGSETKGGDLKTEVIGRGDGRIIATEALTAIGPDRLLDQAEIIAQMRMLAGDNAAYPPLRDMCGRLLKRMNKK